MKSTFSVWLLLLSLCWCSLVIVSHAQSQTVITGTVFDDENQQPIPSANVAWFDSSKTYLQSGVVTDMAGHFRLEITLEAPGVIQISSLGYETIFQNIQPTASGFIQLGDINLKPALLEHEEIQVVGKQVQARSQADRTTYYINQNLKEVTSSGTEVLKFIPGIQVDIMNNISLHGSRKILILINGRERSPDVISRLNVENIEQVEVIQTPPARYDSDVTGVINIILKEKKTPHFNGHIHLEAPGSAEDIYLFPSYSLEYGSGKINLFTSYNGDYRYFNVEEISDKTLSPGSVTTWNTTQYVRQKNWSHKFYYGTDYFATAKHAFSLYGWLNPFSGENDGEIITQNSKSYSSSNREEQDSNLATYHSLHYIFTPDRSAGHELSVNASVFTLNSKNQMIFSNEGTEKILENRTEPSQRTYRFKADYTMPLNNRFMLSTGAQDQYQSMLNKTFDDFKYTDQSLAAYGMLNYRTSRFDIQAAIRAERYQYSIGSDIDKTITGFFPNITFNYKHLQSSQSIKLSYRRSIRYPQLYQLNPGQFFEDPYTYRTGNIHLDPSFIDDVQLEFSRIFGSNYLSLALFYNQQYDVIQSFTKVTDDQLFETNSYNLGDIRQFGVRFSGKLEIGSQIGIQPYFRVFKLRTSPDEFAGMRKINNRQDFVWETGISAYAQFGNEFTVSGTLDYASSRPKFQRIEFNDALYFISLGRSFGQNSKIEVSSGLPFKRSFTYRGYEINSQEFSSRSEGVLKLSAIPLMFKFTFRFSRGDKRDRIRHEDAITPERPENGF